MTTIASPRPSLSLSDRRGSASSSNTITSTATSTRLAPAAVDRGSIRRNRIALRDYYGLKSGAPAEADSPATTHSQEAELESELDKAGFDAQTYVHHLLRSESLEGVLKVEAGLMSDIRSLDGEKKALVYDNYSKLIAATDTIRSMREKMDPLTPTTSTLTPAIGHIAETASSLTRDLRRAAASNNGSDTSVQLQERNQSVQRALVRWVQQGPERIARFVQDGNVEAAQDDWKRVKACLDKWKGVEGTEEIRRKCEAAMQGGAAKG